MSIFKYSSKKELFDEISLRLIKINTFGLSKGTVADDLAIILYDMMQSIPQETVFDNDLAIELENTILDIYTKFCEAFYDIHLIAIKEHHEEDWKFLYSYSRIIYDISNIGMKTYLKDQDHINYLDIAFIGRSTLIYGLGYSTLSSLANKIDIYINMPNAKIQSGAFHSEMIVNLFGTENIHSIGEKAFDGCIIKSELNLPNLCDLGRSAFSDCRIKGVNLEKSSVLNLPLRCFEWCTILNKFSLPNIAATLGKECISTLRFNGTISLPETIILIGKEAFKYLGCFRLEIHSVDYAIDNIQGLFSNTSIKQLYIKNMQPFTKHKRDITIETLRDLRDTVIYTDKLYLNTEVIHLLNQAGIRYIAK